MNEHGNRENTTGDWPSPPFLTEDEVIQLERAVKGIRVMLAKALYHYREKGHLCTFRCDSRIRPGYIEQEGEIICETTEGHAAPRSRESS